MIAAFLRLVLLLLPLVAMGMWLRWRIANRGDEAELQNEFKRLRKTLVVLIILMLLSVLGLWFGDDDLGKAGLKYVPPHSENGKVVPGEFVPADKDKPSETPQDRKKDTPDDTDGGR
ncbi:hypothetical protein [Kordiimonas marina]|uniref:hypothetical protein n=1 Tax=Kordiimonas marina TaxID=2872312 RepID=UPI001FF67E74|nr:hypothetical protein [Kordiimonas marina]MCJ9427527.1 hypothetical protein [Kordiimonas marina]